MRMVLQFHVVVTLQIVYFVAETVPVSLDIVFADENEIQQPRTNVRQSGQTNTEGSGLDGEEFGDVSNEELGSGARGTTAFPIHLFLATQTGLIDNDSVQNSALSSNGNELKEDISFSNKRTRKWLDSKSSTHETNQNSNSHGVHPSQALLPPRWSEDKLSPAFRRALDGYIERLGPNESGPVHRHDGVSRLSGRSRSRRDVESEEMEASFWFERTNRDLSIVSSWAYLALWESDTDLDNYEKRLQAARASMALTRYQRAVSERVNRFEWESFQNETLKKGFRLLKEVAPSSGSQELLYEMAAVFSYLQLIHNEASVCENGSLEYSQRDLENIMAYSVDYDELLWAWVRWREETGEKVYDSVQGINAKMLYAHYVYVMNQDAQLRGFEDAGAAWRSYYTPEPLPPSSSASDYDIRADMSRLYSQVEPLYRLLHWYTRGKLEDQYGSERFPSTGHIPAHLVGNLYGQSFIRLHDRIKPFASGTFSSDVESQLQQMTPVQIARVAEEFFMSMGLEPMPSRFWERSIFEEPTNRSMNCHARAVDFANGRDFRLIQCSEKTFADFVTLHHEMGHIENYLLYQHLPFVFRESANPGFDEAIGDLIALSMRTPQHMLSIGFTGPSEISAEDDMNFLLSVALQYLPFLSYAKTLEEWRWDVFNGNISYSEYSTVWWNRRCKNQGLSPPVLRGTDSFDAAAKFHVARNIPYVRYFVSAVLQFQFFRALCERIGHTGPLHQCDFHNSTIAGDALRVLMEKGATQDWQTALHGLTGSREMDASAITEYFQPLGEYLLDESGESSILSSVFQWESACPTDLPSVESLNMPSGQCG